MFLLCSAIHAQVPTRAISPSACFWKHDPGEERRGRLVRVYQRAGHKLRDHRQLGGRVGRWELLWHPYEVHSQRQLGSVGR